MSFLFRGWTSSSSLEELCLRDNQISAAGVRCLVSFLQHANNLKQIDIGDNNIQSEGFNFLCRSLRDSPIESLNCSDCDIESIEIDMNYFPRRLTHLYLADNNINADGCREIAKLLQREDSVLERLDLGGGSVNDENISYLFRGLTSSSSIKELWLRNNRFTIAGVRSMVPFLQHANNLQHIDLDGSNIQSEGFNFLLRALRDSPIEELWCIHCGIESIEIDTDHFPRHLIHLHLSQNNINADGCREVAKLLQSRDSTLRCLDLYNNTIDDEGVTILVDALQGNTSLRTLDITANRDITNKGQILLLKLVNDISSIKAALQSNHTLTYLSVARSYAPVGEEIRIHAVGEEIRGRINMATTINQEFGSNPEAAGRENVIQFQLHTAQRAELAELQGVSQSVYSEINPLHLPEVLSLIGHTHGQGELYLALKSSIAQVISTVNRRKCIQQKRDYHAAIVEQLNAELAAIDATAAGVTHTGSKSRRKWWWGIWGTYF